MGSAWAGRDPHSLVPVRSFGMISQIIATGSYHSQRILWNEDLRQFPATAIRMVAAKNGVVGRRQAAKGQCPSVS
jgi:hypothetical protein